ncbi:hypothetical protein [Roseomonas xinghualingensis]|uniref:hypothetical protein n=1 Tax=Roseomonas xinghualingensis TaxID=2986475 RepID=UPI0021F14C0B|nr:hypothetical protein [Roseomonas sp. SXEYE001]MCV4210012.1 hypothetical protein [Roseomonas sp. SXEYE001]
MPPPKPPQPVGGQADARLSQAFPPSLNGDQIKLLKHLTHTFTRFFEVYGETKPAREAVEERPEAVDVPELPGRLEGKELAARIRRLVKLRADRRRSQYEDLFDWPAWDMLLDLAVVRIEEGHISVSAVCISSGAPQSTALRKLAALERAKLVHRYARGTDGRRVHIGLTDEGLRLVMETLVGEVALYRG